MSRENVNLYLKIIFRAEVGWEEDSCGIGVPIKGAHLTMDENYTS